MVNEATQRRWRRQIERMADEGSDYPDLADLMEEQDRRERDDRRARKDRDQHGR